ncbi:helix-turn-helix domain-containing protein [Actinoplanes sp. NBRC 101535]|uniref:TetR/AcrR family transcriptional regulator n=1 Tax=Actinoplanes sp. NBRC 101535 TaxID=3032196 RepID=UPI0024A4A253|nr:helix-turn-helix domain-containing protein [Actinoplanes sp. NBRC 101535]GLY07848.1 hypothetical protein Acsp01_82270 [Actinoplanes sp. NBRC 101535]
MPTQRSDAQRNYTRILAVAAQEIATHGADASMEQIARGDGVGSATVRRHFPIKRDLLDAAFRKRVDALEARARDLADTRDARAALLGRLAALVEYATSHPGAGGGVDARRGRDGRPGIHLRARHRRR